MWIPFTDIFSGHLHVGNGCGSKRDFWTNSVGESMENGRNFSLVCHALHVNHDVLLSYDTQKTSEMQEKVNSVACETYESKSISPIVYDQNLSQSQFPEHVDDRFHGRVVSDGNRSQVEDATQFDRRMWRCADR